MGIEEARSRQVAFDRIREISLLEALEWLKYGYEVCYDLEFNYDIHGYEFTGPVIGVRPIPDDYLNPYTVPYTAGSIAVARKIFFKCIMCGEPISESIHFLN